MQIFWLHEDPERNAELYNDKHCSKIILEIGQIISTAARINGVEDDRLYKKTHCGAGAYVVRPSSQSRTNEDGHLFRRTTERHA